MNKTFLLVLTLLWTLPASSRAQVSGQVEVLEKGGVKRPVIQDVLVYIDGVSVETTTQGSARHQTIRSRNKAFEPRVAAVLAGTTVTFPNLDDIMHNVFSLSKGNRFDLGLYKSGAQKDFVLRNPGLVRVYCNIHPQMSAFVHVTDNPYYTWAQPDGAFRIEGVPPGRYTLRVWNEQEETTKPVLVTEQGASGVLVQLDVSSYKRRPHLNKFGKPYKKKRGKY